jgi:hypothetical protein
MSRPPTWNADGTPRRLRRGHASDIIDMPLRIDKALDMLQRCRYTSDPPALNGVEHSIPQRKGRDMQRDYNCHLTVCIDYILMDLFDVAYILTHPDYPKPWEVNAYSVCGVDNCIEATHLEPGRTTAWANQYGEGGADAPGTPVTE